MKTFQIGLIMFQVICVCFSTMGLGYTFRSRGVPKWLTNVNIGVLILNLILILNNLCRL